MERIKTQTTFIEREIAESPSIYGINRLPYQRRALQARYDRGNRDFTAEEALFLAEPLMLQPHNRLGRLLELTGHTPERIEEARDNLYRGATPSYLADDSKEQSFPTLGELYTSYLAQSTAKNTANLERATGIPGRALSQIAADKQGSVRKDRLYLVMEALGVPLHRRAEFLLTGTGFPPHLVHEILLETESSLPRRLPETRRSKITPSPISTEIEKNDRPKIFLTDYGGQFPAEIVDAIAEQQRSIGRGPEMYIVGSTFPDAQGIDIGRYIQGNDSSPAILVEPNIINGSSSLIEMIPHIVVEGGVNLHATEKRALINFDHTRGISLAIEYLKQLGHTKIAYFRGPSAWAQTAHRRDIFLQLYKEFFPGMEPEILYAADSYSNRDSFTHGTHMMETLHGMRANVTAILAHNDTIAIGAIRKAVDLGYRIPEDLSVIGYGDEEIAAYYSIPLTSVTLPKPEVAAAVNKLTRTHQETGEFGENRVIIAPTGIAKRATAGIAKNH